MSEKFGTVLFVDDQIRFLETIRESFAGLGYHQVLLASNVSDAWLVVRSNDEIRHVVCDLRMPGGGAVEFLRRVRRLSPSIGCTLLTGFAKEMLAEEWSSLAQLKVDVVSKHEISEEWIVALVNKLKAEGPICDIKTKQLQDITLSDSNVHNVFDVFLSYNNADQPAVKTIAEQLREDGLRVWLDDWELVPGRPWQDALEKMIQFTKTAAVFVGASGLGPWERPEMRACLSEFVARSMPVIPVLLPPAKGAPELPLFLRQFTWVDMRRGITRDIIHRLEWGITGEKHA